ncbi:hypothetical protein Tco_1285990 [Tanacetum coccineum]
MVTRFDRLDLEELYNLVMKRFETTTLEGVDLVLWGDLSIMFDANAEDELWQNQERWNLKSWDFYENCGVHTLILEDGTEIHMLAREKLMIWKPWMESGSTIVLNVVDGSTKVSTGRMSNVSLVTATEIQAVEKERKAKNILLMAIPKEHMRRFHGMDDAKEIWEAIKLGSGYQQKDRKPSQNDKTEHGMEKTLCKIRPKSKKCQSQSQYWKNQQSNHSRTEEYLLIQTKPHR